MQISEQTRFFVYVILAIIGIGITVGIGYQSITTSSENADKIAQSLNSAFRHAESTIESGFSRTYSKLNTVEEASVIMALGSEDDRPAWSNFLRKVKTEATDKGFIKTTAKGFITTEAGEKRLSGQIQDHIRDIAKQNLNLSFQELAARVVEKLGIQHLSSRAKVEKVSLNEMIAIVAGFAERIRSK